MGLGDPRTIQVISMRAPVTNVGLDISKSIFQVHAQDDSGVVTVSRTLSRGRVLPFFEGLPPSLVGIEVGGTAHYWGRELSALGHDVRLIPPRDVKPFVRRDKTDANDAEAICEAVQRPHMRFVPIKSAETQAAMGLHRSRELLVKQRSQVLNMLRSLLAEFGVAFPLGTNKTFEMLDRLARGQLAQVPHLAQEIADPLTKHARNLEEMVEANREHLCRWHEQSELSQRLATIPGIGIISATAFASTVVDPERFRTARQFASWLGLTPSQRSSGKQHRYGKMSRRGDAYLRRLLILGTTSVALQARRNPDRAPPLVVNLLERRPLHVVRVAMANRTARIAWAIMMRGGTYRSDLLTG